MKLEIRRAEKLQDIIDCLMLRVEVFIKEQGFKPGYEPDEDDKAAAHYIVRFVGKTVGTGRVREVAPGEFKIERMAVSRDFRNLGVGKELCLFMVNDIKRRRPKRIWLMGQTAVQKFYEKCGFKPVSKPYEKYGVMHVDMEYSDKPTRPS